MPKCRAFVVMGTLSLTLVLIFCNDIGQFHHAPVEMMSTPICNSVSKTSSPTSQQGVGISEWLTPNTPNGVHTLNSSSQDDASNVLIVAYKRTGSTFLGQLLGARDDTFYWHEPLRFLRRTYYYRDQDLLCHYNKPVCEVQSQADLLTMEDYRGILKEIFNCNFTSVSTKSDLLLNNQMNAKSPSWGAYRRCAILRGLLACKQMLIDACKSAKHRVIKVVRTDLAGVLVLYKNVPRLKIVHLFRDPRGTINSRFRSTWYTKDFNIKTSRQKEDETKVLCSMMKHNLPIAKASLRDHSGHFKIIQYEDFEHLDLKLCNLLTFLGMACSDRHIRQSLSLTEPVVNQVTLFTDKSSQGNHPFMYRTQLDWNVVKMVDKHCEEVYTELGFEKFDSERELRDLVIFSSLISQKLPFEL